MEKKTSFEDYYLEIAKEARVSVSAHLMARVRRSSDPYLNDIPLTVWDAESIYYQQGINRVMRARGDFWSLAGGVCTLKVLARHKINQEKE